MKKNFSVTGLIKHIAYTIIAVLVGGYILHYVGDVVLYSNSGIQSSLFKGFQLLGWTVNSTGAVTATDGGSGLLVIVGIVAFASLVMKFVDFKM